MQRYYKYTFKLNASHNNGGANHSHTFNIVLYIKQKTNNFTEYTHVEKKIREYLNGYSLKLLNTCDDFKNINPTIENMSILFFNKLTVIINDENFELIKLELSDNILKKFTVSNDIVIGGCMNVVKRKDMNYD